MESSVFSPPRPGVPRHLPGLSAARAFVGLATCFAIISLAGCDRTHKSAGTPSPKPANVAKKADESKLNTIELIPEAVERLKIVTVPVKTLSVQRTRTIGGEVTLPTGAVIVVSAPLTGTLQSAVAQPIPRDGAPLHFGQVVFQLMPLLSPERAVMTPSERINYVQAQNTINTARIDAAGLVEQAKTNVANCKMTLDRVESQLQKGVGLKKNVDDAQGALTLAEKQLEAAEARKKQVDEIKLDDGRDSGNLKPLPIVAPHDGIIRIQHAAAGEVVAAGHPLFEVMQCDPVWIKASIYVGDLAEVDQQAPAKIGPLSGAVSAKLLEATPVPAPPTATPLASSVDLYYELKNPNCQYRPGQRLGVTLSLNGNVEQRAVPWSAVEIDFYGGTWVYEKTAENTFVRRKLQIRHLVDNDQWVTFERGPEVGAEIVVAGVAELSGTEFGFGGK